tara:strand:+ start:565 stop:1758 length:1194 start_codon:yes stop_codon:yes gene_type:complete
VKKILFLGASGSQISPIQYSKSKGYFIITVDNVPENPGHKLSDEYINLSITEKKDILQICLDRNIDAVIGYASDLAASTQAYISSNSKLIGPPLIATEILINKIRFREYLKENNLQRIFFKRFFQNEVHKLKDVISSLPRSRYIIKPVDSAGSKGVYIFNKNDFDVTKAEESFNFSNKKEIILEEFLEKKSPQICGDGFIFKNKIIFIDFGDGHFHDFESSPVPFGETFGGSLSKNLYKKIELKIQEILSNIEYEGPFNFDVFWLGGNNFFINEIGPRSGGNFIPNVIGLRNQFDFIGTLVEYYLGALPEFPKMYSSDLFYASYMIHSKQEMIYSNISIHPELLNKIHSQRLFIQKGTKVNKFKSGNHSVGNIIFEFSTFEEMNETYKNIYNLIKIC